MGHPGAQQLSRRPASPLVKVRRKLSPTPVGKVWRLAKRLRRELAPTPVGEAYRGTRRAAREFLAFGCEKAVTLRHAVASAHKAAASALVAGAAELPGQSGLPDQSDGGRQSLSVSPSRSMLLA